MVVHRPIVYGNVAIPMTVEERDGSDHTHRWTVAVRSAAAPANPQRGELDRVGGADDISYFVKKVTFKLHETYPNPTRSEPAFLDLFGGLRCLRRRFIYGAI